jgi:hypothetical protein
LAPGSLTHRSSFWNRKTAQEGSGDEEEYSPMSDGVSDLSDVEFTFARSTRTAAGSRKRRRLTSSEGNGLAEDPMANSAINSGKPKPVESFREVIKIDEDSEDEDEQLATGSPCSPVPAAFPVKYGKRREVEQLTEPDPKVTVFDFSSTGGRLWRFSLCRGPVRPFPENLLKILQEWDQIHRDCRPPCTSYPLDRRAWTTGSNRRIYQIFGEEGEEMEVASYKVTVDHQWRKRAIQPPFYYVCVPFSEKEQPRLWKHHERVPILFCISSTKVSSLSRHI